MRIWRLIRLKNVSCTCEIIGIYYILRKNLEKLTFFFFTGLTMQLFEAELWVFSCISLLNISCFRKKLPLIDMRDTVHCGWLLFVHLERLVLSRWEVFGWDKSSGPDFMLTVKNNKDNWTAKSSLAYISLLLKAEQGVFLWKLVNVLNRCN